MVKSEWIETKTVRREKRIKNNDNDNDNDNRSSKLPATSVKRSKKENKTKQNTHTTPFDKYSLAHMSFTISLPNDL